MAKIRYYPSQVQDGSSDESPSLILSTYAVSPNLTVPYLQIWYGVPSPPTRSIQYAGRDAG